MKTSTDKSDKKAKLKKSKSPFRSHSDFEEEIRNFANKYKTIVVNQAKRTSDYFEMSCYNYIIRFYDNNGYEVNVENLQSKKYRYKCSPAGIQSNFSYFSVCKKNGDDLLCFEIQHNLAVQSSHDVNIFTTPDISIIKKDTVRYSNEYYNTKKTFSYVENQNFVSFCEVKQFNPFPELLFNFIGVLNELKKDYMSDKKVNHKTSHIAPCLMISGKPNKQTMKIRESLEDRYFINIFYDLFYNSNFTFSKMNIVNIRKTG